jgi:hypothetical protein
MDSNPDPIDCLLLCSDSPYDADVLPGPPQASSKEVLAITGWEKVRPSAVYDLWPAITYQEPRRRKRQSNDQALLRDVVSMPNLCTKADSRSETQKWSYMSGQLDEDFSYVYTGGLSERCCKANAEAEYKKSSHDSQKTSVSTCNLVLDPASLFSSRHHAYVEPALTQYDEISKIQLKPKLLAQQLRVENRLRNIDLNAHPDLQKDNVRSSGREKGDIEGTSTDTCTASLTHVNSSHLQQTRKLMRQRRPKPKMWRPPPLSEEPHQPLSDSSFNTRPQANRISTKHPNSVMTANGKKGLHNQFGFGSFHHAGIPGKQLTSTHAQVPRSGEKSINHKEKWRTTFHVIFDQDKCNHRSRSPQAPASQSQAQAWKQEHSQTIPIFVPSLEQEQAMIPKRFSKYTALQMKPSAPSSVITDRLLYAE